MRVVSLLEYRRFVDGLDPPSGSLEKWLSPRLVEETVKHELPLQEIIDYVWA